MLLRRILRKYQHLARSYSSGEKSISSFLATKTVQRQNGEKEKRLFTDKEYQRRLASLRKTMAEKNISACVFTSMHNTAYFSNFVYCSFGRPYGVVVTMDNEPCSLSALIDGGQPWRRSYGSNIVYTDWQRDNYFVAVKEALGNIQGKIGVEFDHLSFDNHKKLQSIVPESILVDVGVDTAKQRMVKSEEEIEIIKLGAATADIGGEACKNAMKEGVAECEVAREGVAAMIKNIADKVGDKSELLDTWVWFQSGLNTDGAHNPLTSRKLKAGDILSLNCFPMIQGYYTALERTMFLGHVDEASLKYWEANVAVHKRGLELIKPGAKCSEIAAELNDLFDSFGLLKYRSFGYGHSFGVLSHYYGREAGLELREDIETVIEPGMVVSMEPMITIPEGQPGAGGYREHDVLVINEDGTVDDITGYPFGPEHNIIKN